ncbi:MAG TPA: hypothetical protein VGM44_00330, partial [Polyangiaceae bacterium]
MILVSRRATSIVALFGLASLALGCGKKDAAAADTTGASSGAASAAALAAGPITLQGSGASFPAPLYSRW